MTADSPCKRQRTEGASQQALDDYGKKGYCIVRQFLPSETIDDMVSTLEKHSASLGRVLHSPELLCSNEKNPADDNECESYFRNLAQHPAVHSLTSALIGSPPSLRAAEYFGKAPGGKLPTPPHQDNFYFAYGLSSCLTVWIALDEVDEDNGCMSYMEYDAATEKHANGKVGLLPHTGNQEWVPAAGFSSAIKDWDPADEKLMTKVVGLKPGDAVIHHCQCIHAGCPNVTTDRRRRAVAFIVHHADCAVSAERQARYKACVAESAANGRIMKNGIFKDQTSTTESVKT